MPNRPVHFEIHAENPERAVEFYSKAFGWEISKWNDPNMEYWMVMTGPRGPGEGINGGLIRRKGPTPAEGAPVNAWVVTMQVDSYDDVAAKILANGGTVAAPKFAFPGMAWQGYFKDTEGNIIGLHQVDKDAK